MCTSTHVCCTAELADEISYPIPISLAINVGDLEFNKRKYKSIVLFLKQSCTALYCCSAYILVERHFSLPFQEFLLKA